MIELVFTIVIIAVLATMAIPKLMATRDDAKVASKVMQISNAINEITTYSTSKGDIDTNLTKMSNVVNEWALSGQALSDENETKIKIDGVECIDMKIVYSNSMYELNVSVLPNVSNNALCDFLQKRASGLFHSFHLSGNTIKR